MPVLQDPFVHLAAHQESGTQDAAFFLAAKDGEAAIETAMVATVAASTNFEIDFNIAFPPS